MDVSPPKIMVVDSSVSLRRCVKNLLLPLQAVIVEADNGIEGIQRASSQNFDLIITGVELPGIDGYEFCRTFKEIDTEMRTPVVILSSLESEKDIEKGFMVGAAGYVRKSSGQQDLLPRVRALLTKYATRGKRALIVDDSDNIIDVLANGLTENGFLVSRAHNGREALESLQETPAHLILSDTTMPVMDGPELYAALQMDRRFADTPFIAMGGNDERSIMLNMISHGASAYLVKPFEVEELIVLSEKLLSDHWKTISAQRQTLLRERDILLSSISSLVSALEARDSYTRSHSENVARLSRALAKHMHLPEEDMSRIELAAKLHDVGKIGIRDNVLLKNGKLNDVERAEIMQHPLKGVGILKTIPSMANVLDGVMHHHERMDGSGYPMQLKGDEIPLDARIIAVADVYDALTSNRPYRKSMGNARAMEIIHDMSGPHLCPDCVDKFESLMGATMAGPAYTQAAQPAWN